MEGTTFVLLIIFLFVLPIVMYGIWTSHRKEMAELNTKLGDSKADALKAELESVKKRLQVLEAIVTDNKYQIDREINQLK